MSSPVPGTVQTPASNGVELSSSSEASVSTPAATDVSVVLQRLIDHAEKSDARLADMGRQLAKLKGVPDNNSPQTTPPSTQSTAPPDWRTAMLYQRKLGGLPDAAQKYIEQLELDGATPIEILRLIDLAPRLSAILSEQADAISAPHRTRDRAATAPPRTAVQHPRTLSEYYQLARENPEQKKLLDKDPTFHPEDLPHRE